MAIKVASVAEMRAVEAAADRSVISYEQMMLNAGNAASAYLRTRVAINSATVIVFLIGKGNNGGDGLIMAHDLASNTSADIRLYLLEMRNENDANYVAIRDADCAVALASDDSVGRILAEWLVEAAVVVDALFGIGLRLPLRGTAAALLQRVRQYCHKQPEDGSGAIKPVNSSGSCRARRPFIFAIDCPSGVDCDSGQVDPNTLTADATMTFIAAKPGLLTFPAAATVGELVMSQIGIPSDLPALQQLQTTLVDSELAASLLPARPLDGHKGTFGEVMLVAGSANYIGAVALAGESACRSGVGLVTIATGRKLIDIVASSLREPTWLPLNTDDGAINEGASETVLEAAQTYDALLIGCGLGLHQSTREFVRSLVDTGMQLPMILDADALNALSQQPEWWESLPAGTIITPHSGEMSRLTGLPTTQINGERWQVARQFAAQCNLVVVLKGAHTIIAAPEGETSVIPIKTAALGTAGTGDVLAGLIAGLRAQGVNAFDSARLGAYVHALAGTIAEENIGSSRSVIAGDVLAALGTAFAQIERA